MRNGHAGGIIHLLSKNAGDLAYVPGLCIDCADRKDIGDVQRLPVRTHGNVGGDGERARYEWGAVSRLDIDFDDGVVGHVGDVECVVRGEGEIIDSRFHLGYERLLTGGDVHADDFAGLCIDDKEVVA